jgi:hypothetical protein
MAKKNLCLGILVMVLVFGMTIIGCDSDDQINSSVDSSLNGTWVCYDYYDLSELKLNNGNFEYFEQGTLWSKGTYITSDNILIMAPTHYYGDIFGEIFESKWYSKNDLSLFFSTEEVSELFASIPFNYIINGNKLTITDIHYNHELLSAGNYIRKN